MSPSAQVTEVAEAPAGAPRRRAVVLATAVLATAVLATAVLAAAVLATAVLLLRPGGDPRTGGRPAAPAQSGPPTTAEVYAAVAPSVVTVQALAGGAVTGTGSGVVVNRDGVVATALGVVRSAAAVRVVFADGTASEAIAFATDPATDTALLTVITPPSVVVPAVLGNPGRLAVGDDVVAVGNPVGLTSSASAGVVSGLDRQVVGSGGGTVSGLIQFDAAVNPGSFGGPLLNARGETVAIVVGLANPTAAGTFIGIGFAVPVGAAVAGRGPQQ